jgi:hypothetical protein
MRLADLGPPIARGGVSELYAWPDGRVLKLFNRGFGARFAADEARITARLHALGLPVPATGDSLSRGPLRAPMQRLDGKMAERATADPTSARPRRAPPPTPPACTR